MNEREITKASRLFNGYRGVTLDTTYLLDKLAEESYEARFAYDDSVSALYMELTHVIHTLCLVCERFHWNVEQLANDAKSHFQERCSAVKSLMKEGKSYEDAWEAYKVRRLLHD